MKNYPFSAIARIMDLMPKNFDIMVTAKGQKIKG